MARKPITPDVSDITDDSVEETALTAPDQGNFALGQVEGDVTPADIRMPSLKIAYGVGGLAENFNPGDLVLGGDNLLVSRGESLRFIVLKIRRYWKEYRSTFDPNAPMPLTFLSEEEVHAHGGTTKWNGSVGPSFSPAAELTMLIEQPEDVICGLFGIHLGEKVYAPAIWHVDKSAYRRVGPIVLTAAQFSLRARGLLSGIFSLSTKTEKINNNNTIVPSVKLCGFNSDDVIKGIEKLFGNETA